MRQQKSTSSRKKLDSYSALICSKYFESSQDFINIICVNSKFKETTEKLRFNPIPIASTKLFPKIQTQHLYSKQDEIVKGIKRREIWYCVNYDKYLNYKTNHKNVKCHNVVYTRNNRQQFGIIIPINVTLLDDECFQLCSITSINLPSTISSLSDYCFYYCESLELIDLPTCLTSIGEKCFMNCSSLKAINLQSPLQKLSNCCFYNCTSLTSINLPSTLQSLGNNCFKNCTSLTSINLSSALTSLGVCCFYNCVSLISINGVDALKIGKNCFKKCVKLKL
ncbi:Leucine rich repeat protein [Entamoeba marina]